jgi:hypothetical protein
MSEIKIVRLNSGEEILCKHTLKDDVHTLEKPLVIIPTGEGKIGFMGWMPYADVAEAGVSISDSFVAFIVNPDKDLKQDYIGYTTGVVAPVENSKKVVAPSLNPTWDEPNDDNMVLKGPQGWSK